MIHAVLGAFVFAGFIIYDTQMNMKYLSAEEYIIGVMNLYLDILNLFIKILRILNALKSEESRSDKKKKRN
jgi:FtsH-binding integral membrane protein